VPVGGATYAKTWPGLQHGNKRWKSKEKWPKKRRAAGVFIPNRPHSRVERHSGAHEADGIIAQLQNR
jgi:hypothetical protein